jgi:hypothetical protein
MTNLLYKDRRIITFARFDEDTKFWIPMADISWGSNRPRASHTITGPLDAFENWQAAERFMTAMAKTWIDDHLH